jgi:hypothetical protein
MRLKDYGEAVTVWLSADDTYHWARRWPCSGLSGKRLRAEFDTNGLLDCAVDGAYLEDLDGAELSAIVADHLADRLDPAHPCYFVTVGQFQA